MPIAVVNATPMGGLPCVRSLRIIPTFRSRTFGKLASVLESAKPIGSLYSPVLDLQPTHPSKFAFIVCNQRQPCNHGMRSDPEIVVSDHLASRFQLRPNRSVRFCRRFRQGECGQHMHELTQSLKRCNSLHALCRAIEQLAVGNHRNGGLPGTELAESAQNFFRSVLPDVNTDIRVQQ